MCRRAEDIKGEIINAGFAVRFGDVLRSITQTFYTNSGWFVLLIYLLVIVLPFAYYHLKVEESLTGEERALAIALFVVGGLLLSSFVMGIKGRRKFSLILFLLWLLLLSMMLLF